VSGKRRRLGHWLGRRLGHRMGRRTNLCLRGLRGLPQQTRPQDHSQSQLLPQQTRPQDHCSQSRPPIAAPTTTVCVGSPPPSPVECERGRSRRRPLRSQRAKMAPAMARVSYPMVVPVGGCVGADDDASHYWSHYWNASSLIIHARRALNGCAGGGGRILWRMQVLTTAHASAHHGGGRILLRSFGACKCSPRRMQVLTTAVAGSFGVSVSVSRQALISNSQTHLETNERSHTNE